MRFIGPRTSIIVQWSVFSLCLNCGSALSPQTYLLYLYNHCPFSFWPHLWVSVWALAWRNAAGAVCMAPSQPCADLHSAAQGNLHNTFGFSFSVHQWPSPPICQRCAQVFLHHISSIPSYFLSLMCLNLPKHTQIFTVSSFVVCKRGWILWKKKKKKVCGGNSMAH